MPEVTIRQMFEAGIHFGHQARFWNPKMAPYIYAERNKIHIIDLDQTLPLLKEALAFLKNSAKEGKVITFVGTKRAAQEAIHEHAERCGMPYVEQRWLGGMLTNFKTINQSIRHYKRLEEEYEKTNFGDMSKKERLMKTRELDKLRKVIYGIKDIRRIPDVLFVIDVRYESIAVKEAAKLGIKVVAIVDTNNSLDYVAYPIPGNDDAISAIQLYASVVADAILEGIKEGKEDGEYVEIDEEAKEDPNAPKIEMKKSLKASIIQDGITSGNNAEAADQLTSESETVTDRTASTE